VHTHLANADSPDLTHACLQLERFNEVVRFYERRSLPMPIRHIANSAAVLQLPESYLDMVRPGIMLYGVYPSPQVPHSIKVEPALAWKAGGVYFKVVKPVHAVRYGSNWQSVHMVRVVTVPSYGYFRSMSNGQGDYRGKISPGRQHLHGSADGQY
jgi:alanine racemase